MQQTITITGHRKNTNTFCIISGMYHQVLAKDMNMFKADDITILSHIALHSSKHLLLEYCSCYTVNPSFLKIWLVLFMHLYKNTRWHSLFDNHSKTSRYKWNNFKKKKMPALWHWHTWKWPISCINKKKK